MPDEGPWVNLYNPSQDAWHRVPNHPVVVQDFQDRGWETPEDSAARVEADAGQLRGAELESALEQAGLPRSGTVKEKQKRLAEHRAEQVPAPEPPEINQAITDPATQADTTTTENEGSE